MSEKREEARRFARNRVQLGSCVLRTFFENIFRLCVPMFFLRSMLAVRYLGGGYHHLRTTIGNIRPPVECVSGKPARFFPLFRHNSTQRYYQNTPTRPHPYCNFQDIIWSWLNIFFYKRDHTHRFIGFNKNLSREYNRFIGIIGLSVFGSRNQAKDIRVHLRQL